MAKILLTEPISEAGMRIARERDDVEIVMPDALDEATLIDAVRDVDAIAVRSARITADVIANAAKLKVVSRHGVGFDSVDVNALTQRQIPLMLAVNANAVSVAEHAFYFLLALAKQSVAYDQAARAGDFAFRNSLHAIDIEGKTLLIVGFGRIGARVAPRALAFGMRVLAYDPYVDDAVIQGVGAEPVDDLVAAADSADFITVHCPKNDATTGLIDATVLSALGPNGYVINTARGGIVEESALAEALRSRSIAGAGMDVFAQEPASASHPLFTLDNIIVSPHSAGVTQQSSIRMGSELMQNVLDALDGHPNPEAFANPAILGAS